MLGDNSFEKTKVEIVSLNSELNLRLSIFIKSNDKKVCTSSIVLKGDKTVMSEGFKKRTSSPQIILVL